MKNNENIKRLKNKTTKMLLTLGFIFLLTSIAGAVIGNLLDSKLNIKPVGSLGTFLVFYLITWVIAVKYSLNIKKELKENNGSATN